MKTRLRRITGRRLAGAGTAAGILLLGLPLVWWTGGDRLRFAIEREHSLAETADWVRQQVAESNRSFLEGEEGALVRSLFESDATRAVYFNHLLDEVARRGRADGMRLRHVSLSPGERAPGLEKAAFQLDVDAPYSVLCGFLRWIEEAYPVYQVTNLRLNRSSDPGMVHAVVEGALLVPRAGEEKEEL